MTKNLSEADSREYGRRMIRDFLIIGGLLFAVAIAFSAAHLTERNRKAGSASRVSGTSGQMPAGMDDVAGLVNTGNQLMDSDRYEEAVLHYSRALVLDSTLVDVRVDRGSSFFALGRYHEAISDFTSAIATDSDHVTAHFNLGITYSTLGHDSLAVYYWQRCIELQPDGDLAGRARELLEQDRE